MSDVAKQYKSFSTKCPHCGEYDDIIVTEVTLSATGEVLEPHVELHEDGFEFDLPDDRKDASTENEQCWCLNCEMPIPLSKLTL